MAAPMIQCIRGIMDGHETLLELRDAADAEFAVSYALEWRDNLLGELYTAERKYRCAVLLEKQKTQKAHEEVLSARQRALSAFKGVPKIIGQVRESGLACHIEPLLEGRQVDNPDVLPTDLIFVYSESDKALGAPNVGVETGTLELDERPQ